MHRLPVRSLIFPLRQLPQPHPFRPGVGPVHQPVRAQNHPFLVRKLPCGDISLIWAFQPGKRALLRGVPQLLDLFHLPADFFHVLRRLGAQIQLISEIATHRHVPPHTHGGHPARLVIRHGGHMGPHGAGGIAQACAPLNKQSLRRVRIVAGPGLRHVVQHPGVKPAASAAAALKQHLREGCRNLLQHPVEPQHVPVGGFAFPPVQQQRGTGLLEVPVHVPFDIADVRAFQHVGYRSDHIFLYILPAHVQNQLIPCGGSAPALRVQAPVRMRPVQVAVRRYHLRLKPQPEFHPQGVDVPGQGLQSSRQLFPVHPPVSQGAVVVIPFSEPSVVQHKQLNSRLAGRPGDLQDFFMIEVEIGGFPVVDQHRPFPVPPRAPADALPDQAVKGLAHGVHALAGVDQQRLRALKMRPGLQPPLKGPRVQSQRQPGRSVGVLVRRDRKISAVDQRRSQAFSAVFGGVCRRQRRKGIVFMAGGAPGGSDGPGHGGRSRPLHSPFLGPGAVQMNHVIPPRQRHADAPRVLQRQRLRPLVSIQDARGDHRPLRKQRVSQLRGQPRLLVLQRNIQGLRFSVLLRIGARQALWHGLPRLRPVANVKQLRAPLSGPFHGADQRRSVIPPSLRGTGVGQHLPQAVKGSPLPQVRHVQAAVRLLQRLSQVSRQQLLPPLLVRPQAQNHGQVPVPQMERPFLAVKSDHVFLPFRLFK